MAFLTDDRYKSRKFKLTLWALVVLTILFAAGPIVTFIVAMLGGSFVLEILPASGFVTLVPIILGIYSGANVLDAKNEKVSQEDQGDGSGGAPDSVDVL